VVTFWHCCAVCSILMSWYLLRKSPRPERHGVSTCRANLIKPFWRLIRTDYTQHSLDLWLKQIDSCIIHSHTLGTQLTYPGAASESQSLVFAARASQQCAMFCLYTIQCVCICACMYACHQGTKPLCGRQSKCGTLIDLDMVHGNVHLTDRNDAFTRLFCFACRLSLAGRDRLSSITLQNSKHQITCELSQHK